LFNNKDSELPLLHSSHQESNVTYIKLMMTVCKLVNDRRNEFLISIWEVKIDLERRVGFLRSHVNVNCAEGGGRLVAWGLTVRLPQNQSIPMDVSDDTLLPGALFIKGRVSHPVRPNRILVKRRSEAQGIKIKLPSPRLQWVNCDVEIIISKKSASQLDCVWKFKYFSLLLLFFRTFFLLFSVRYKFENHGKTGETRVVYLQNWAKV